MSAALISIVEQPGDILSPSSANQYLGCSAKFYFRKIVKLPDPPTGSLALGSALHHAIGENFAQKCETHEDLPAEGVVSLFRQAWDLKIAGELPNRHRTEPELPAEFRDDENPDELKAMGEALVRKYMTEAAPAIDPAAVELPVNGRLGNVPVRGYVDLLDTQGRIIDLKSVARKPSEISTDYRFQVATYSQLAPGATGQARLDTLTKTKTPALIQQEFTIDQADIDSTEKIYPLVQRSIRAQTFFPNRASNLCSRRYCAFWRRCEREFGGRVAE